jgi:Fic family protein
MFVLKNLHKLDRIPDKLRENIFEKLFLTAEIAKFSKTEHQHYEDSLKYYRDLKNSLDTAKAEGEQIGLQKVALNAKKKGMSIKDISELTGLSEEEISAL